MSRTSCSRLVLGAVIIAIGLQFRSTIQSAQDTIIGCVLIATGIGFTVLELSGHGHGHDHEHDLDPATTTTTTTITTPVRRTPGRGCRAARR